MSKMWLAGMLGLALVACSNATAKEPERDAGRWPSGQRAVDRTLVAGTLVEVTIHRLLSRRGNTPGETLMASVSADVRNGHRWVVIPAGCEVSLQAAPWRPVGGAQADGKMLFDVTSVTVWGQVYPVKATIALGHRASGEVVVAPETRILFVLREGFTAPQRLDSRRLD